MEIPFPHLAIGFGAADLDDLLMQFHQMAPWLQPTAVGETERDGRTLRTISLTSTSDTLTLFVVLTNAPGGSVAYGLSVDYSDAIGKLSKIAYSRTLPAGYQFNLGELTNTGTQVRNFSAGTLGVPVGGISFVVGTITFDKNAFSPGTFVITTVIVASDDILGGISVDERRERTRLR